MELTRYSPFSLIICCDGAPAKDCHGTHLLWCHTIMPYKQPVKVALLVESALTGNFRKLQIRIIDEIYTAFKTEFLDMLDR
jgi:hypothetical protein